MKPAIEDVRTNLADRGLGLSPVSVADAMRACGQVVTDVAVADTLATLRNTSTGAGELEDLLGQAGVTDVLVNGADQVFVDRGQGLERIGTRFADEAQVRALATRLAVAAGQRLDDASPFVDARLPDGTRLHAVLAPVSEPGTLISLRVPARSAFSLSELVRLGLVPPAGAELLRAMVAAGAAFLVSGGTGSGKTTLLAALLSLVDPRQRIIVVEESKELKLDHPHWVRLEARPKNSEGAGGLTLQQLVRQALRMRPDRVTVGEVRGAEVVDLLTALNTGHEGGCGTVHANSIRHIPARLEALAALGGMDRVACHAQAAAALEVAVHLVRGPTGQRRVAEIGVFAWRAGELCIESAVRFEGRDLVWGEGADQLKEVTGWLA